LKDKVIYFEAASSDESLRRQLQEEGIQVIEVDNYIDPHFIQHAEIHKQGDQATQFVSIDSEVENLLESANTGADDIKIKEMFEGILKPKGEKESALEVEIKNFKNVRSSAYFKVDANMKRLQQMTKSMGQTN